MQTLIKKAKVIGLGTLAGVPQVQFKTSDQDDSRFAPFTFSIPMTEEQVLRFKYNEEVEIAFNFKGWG